MEKKEARRLLKKIEEFLLSEEASAWVKDRPRRGAVGGRVTYVALAGRAKAREALSARAAQVMRFLDRKREATARALQAALRVNRNVVAGAIHELKQAGLVRSEEVGVESAAEYAPRRKAASRKKGTR